MGLPAKGSIPLGACLSDGYPGLNGPDNAGLVAPDDVRAVAGDEGIPIYVISTAEASKDQISAGVFRRLSRLGIDPVPSRARE